MSFLGKIFSRPARTERLDATNRKEPVLHSTDVWSFGPFSMAAVPAFSYVTGHAPAIYKNVAGDVAMITVNVLSGVPAAAQAREIVERALAHAKKTFDAAAMKFGAAPCEPATQLLGSGDTLLSYSVSTSEGDGRGYLLQYAVVAPVGHLTIITVEGRGEVSVAASTLEKSIASARFAA